MCRASEREGNFEAFLITGDMQMVYVALNRCLSKHWLAALCTAFCLLNHSASGQADSRIQPLSGDVRTNAKDGQRYVWIPRAVFGWVVRY